MPQPTLAIVGAGHLGRIHAKLAQSIEGIQPVVIEPDSNAREYISTEFRIPTFESLERLPSSPDGAVIVTPTESHASIAHRLLERDCHLLVEKPICSDTTESTELCRAAERQGKILQVGHVERFNPAFVAARPLVEDVRFIEASRLTPYSFRATDVSVVLDLMIHDIDLVLSLVPSPVAQVRAHGTTVIGPHVDIAKAWIEFENGAVASLTASRCSYDGDRSMNIVSTDRHLNINFAKQKVTTMTSDEQAAATLSAISSPEETKAAKENLFDRWLPVSDVPVVPQNAILEEQLEFVRCMQDGSTPTVSGWDGAAAVHLAERISNAIDSAAKPAGKTAGKQVTKQAA